MHQQAMRSAGSRIKPDVVAIKTCIRTFSTTQLRTTDKTSFGNKDSGGAAPSKREPLSTGRERSRAAASEIGQLLRRGPRAGGASNNAAALNVGAAIGAKPKVIDIKTLPNRGGFGGTNFVKLPQGFGARGRPTGGRKGPSGFSAGRPSRGGRGGRRPKRGGEDDANEADKKADRASTYERFFRPETAEEHTYVQAREQGFLPEAFTPSVSVEGLLGFAPSMPIASASSAVAAPAAVMRSLRDLAGEQHYTPEHWSDMQHTATELVFRGKGMYFFSDLAERDKFLGDVQAVPEDDAATSAEIKAVRAAKLEEGAGQAVREYIIDRVLKGRHRAPQFVERGSRDPVSMARESHLANETYGTSEGRKFDGKIAALMAKRKPAAGGKTASA